MIRTGSQSAAPRQSQRAGAAADFAVEKKNQSEAVVTRQVGQPIPDREELRLLFTPPQNPQAFSISHRGGRSLTNAHGAPRGRSAPLEAETFRSLGELHQGDEIAIPLFDGVVAHGIVKLARTEAEGWTRVAGKLSGEEEGTFHFSSHSSRKVVGRVLLPRKGLALEVGPDPMGRLQLRERRLSEVMCYAPAADMLPASDVPVIRRTEPGPPVLPPALSSRPGAVSVLYLDFDGEQVVDPNWNGGLPINAEHSGLTTEEMTEIWREVKDDFIAFDVDVTTSASRYHSAPVGQRMRCIITPSNEWYADDTQITGVAFNTSFKEAGYGWFGSDIPCWAFAGKDVPLQTIAATVSHEIGHTFGLDHDGAGYDEYYYGQPAHGEYWNAIMGGASPYATFRQWSRGEYQDATNQEDDLAIIGSGVNGFGFVPDEAPEDIVESVALQTVGTVVSQSGVIGANLDVDTFAFTTTGGDIQIQVTPGDSKSDLDVALALIDATGALIAVDAPVTDRSAAISTTLLEGIYYMKVSGDADGDGLTSGYTRYGSIGEYKITGTIAGLRPVPRLSVPSVLEVGINTPFEHQLAVTNGPVSYSVEGALPPGLTLDSASGMISGTPTVAGVYRVVFTVANAAGDDARPVVIRVQSASGGLVEAFAPQIYYDGAAIPVPVGYRAATPAHLFNWTTGGDKVWFPDPVAYRNDYAARSGMVKDGQESWMQTVVSGPARLRFKVRTSSEEGYDPLIFSIDAVEQARFSGLENWKEVSYLIPAGTHVVRWTYQKDETGSSGRDCAWVNDLYLVGAPVITSNDHVKATAGKPLLHFVEYNGMKGTVGIEGTLPPGVTYSAEEGRFSGKPETTGTFPFTVKVQNEFGETSQNLIIEITAKAVADIGKRAGDAARDWLTGGDAPWFAVSGGGDYALPEAQSGKIADGQSSWIEATFTGPVIIGFDWRVSSQNKKDVFKCLLDDRVVGSISGDVDWDERSLYIPEGTHRVRWIYQKDPSVSAGDDAAHLRDVRIQAVRLQVSVEGRGTVTREYNGQTFQELGDHIVIKALPQPGWRFKEWTGSLTSTQSALAFGVEKGMRLVARFEQEPLPEGMTGRFQGPIELRGSEGIVRTGYCSVRLLPTGAITGYITIEGTRIPLKSALTAQGRFQASIYHELAGSLVIDLGFSTDANGVARMAGTLAAARFASPAIAELSLERSPYSSAKPCVQAGRYTAIFAPVELHATSDDYPRGAGFATLEIAPEGAIRLAGRLADGTPLAYSTYVRSDGSWNLYSAFKGKMGFLSGTITPETDLSPDAAGMRGTLEWLKQGTVGGRGLYPGGFLTTLHFLGGRYSEPAQGEPMFSWFAERRSDQSVYAPFGNGSFAIGYGNMPMARSVRAYFRPDNRVDTSRSGYPHPKITLNPKTGLFSGSFMHPIENKRVRFQGAMIQRNESGAGYFLSGGRSGMVNIGEELER